MKIIDLLNKEKFTLSFEVFPPKAESAFDSVKTATEEIAKLSPSFMSVTYGAGGGTSKYTLDIAKNILKEYSVPTLAHLTCVSSTKETVKEQISQIKNAGIKNVMALRGDIPKELENADRSGWDYRYAIDLVRELKQDDYDFCIGGACYPEIHPESANQKDDIKYLKENNLQPTYNVTFAIPYNEEIGLGGTYLPEGISEYLAIDIGLIGPDLDGNERSVSICAKDNAAPYDYLLTNRLIECAKATNTPYAVDVFFRYGTDANAAMRAGNNIRAAAFGMAVYCSHGMERTHIDGLIGTTNILLEYLLN